MARLRALERADSIVGSWQLAVSYSAEKHIILGLLFLGCAMSCWRLIFQVHGMELLRCAKKTHVATNIPPPNISSALHVKDSKSMMNGIHSLQSLILITKAYSETSNRGW